MALPSDFNEFEFLQDTVRRVHNQIVREEFSDLGGEDWEPDLSIGRGALRYASTLKDNDSADMNMMRMWLYYVMLRKARDLHPAIYGIPVPDYQDDVTFRPQVKLYFSQDLAAIPDGKSAIRSEISFRLMEETSATMTVTKAKTLANKIKTEFATGTHYIWDKGKYKCTYRDPKHGYALSINALSEAEGETVIKKVVSIGSHTFDPDKFSCAHPKKNSVNTPVGKSLIYGKQHANRRWRPTAKVRFRWATLQIHGIERDIHLVDTTGYFSDPLVTA